jgi:hypothetical protein
MPLETTLCGEPLEIDVTILNFTGDPNSTLELAFASLASFRMRDIANIITTRFKPRR